jgi:DNA-binding LytR/AlgR family response regulator
VFTLGYAAVSVILYQYFANKQLQIKVQELSEVKNINQGLYKKLKNENEDTSSILNIKIGNKHKIIPIKNIRWIESDDYCVKIHTDNDISYSMRSSLKSLEDKLSTNNFLRVHRNALVNMKMAKEMDFSNTPKLILEDATEVLISKSKIKKVRDFLK